jgi:hypothetical protein
MNIPSNPKLEIRWRLNAKVNFGSYLVPTKRGTAMEKLKEYHWSLAQGPLETTHYRRGFFDHTYACGKVIKPNLLGPNDLRTKLDCTKCNELRGIKTDEN